MQELSLAALAKAMGMSAPALYRYFPSRDALVEAPVVAALARWGRQAGADPGAGPAVLRLGVLLWSRVHGLVSLELAGAFESMGIDGELLLTSELEAITRNGC